LLCNLTTHNANELRNIRVAQKKISEQFLFYATDCANCQSAPYTVNQLHNTQFCATRLIVNGPLLTSALDGGEQSASRPRCFTPGTHWIAGLDAVEKRKVFALFETVIFNLDHCPLETPRFGNRVFVSSREQDTKEGLLCSTPR
jgi:hypothetical protein